MCAYPHRSALGAAIESRASCRPPGGSLSLEPSPELSDGPARVERRVRRARLRGRTQVPRRRGVHMRGRTARARCCATAVIRRSSPRAERSSAAPILSMSGMPAGAVQASVDRSTTTTPCEHARRSAARSPAGEQSYGSGKLVLAGEHRCRMSRDWQPSIPASPTFRHVPRLRIGLVFGAAARCACAWLHARCAPSARELRASARPQRGRYCRERTPCSALSINTLKMMSVTADVSSTTTNAAHEGRRPPVLIAEQKRGTPQARGSAGHGRPPTRPGSQPRCTSLRDRGNGASPLRRFP
jgi:hypothetical protein